MPFKPKDAIDAARDVVQNAVERSSDIVENAGHNVFEAHPDVQGLLVRFFGGEPMDGPRYIWWNFVSRSKDRIEQAKADWRARRFEAVPDESEFIPLPD